MEKLLTEGGLAVDRLFKTESYATCQYHVDDASGIFDNAVAGPMMRNFGEDGIRDKAKALFVKRLGAMAGPDGMMHEDLRFYVGIGRKIET